MGKTEKKPPERKPWDPNCPKCREELQRHSDLWQAQYDDVDHGAGIYRLLFEHYCTHENGQKADRAVRFVRKEDQGMGQENGPKDVAHYGHPPFIAPEIGEEPPVGARVAKEIVCRDCMTAAEEISMRRGFADPISAKEAREKGTLCTRCGKAIPAGS